MGVLEGVEHLARDAHRFVYTELRLAIELVAQRLAGDERHHVEQEPVRRAGVEQRQDVRMLEARGGRDLLHEPLGAEDGGQLGFQ